MREQSKGLFKATLQAVSDDLIGLSEELDSITARSAEIQDAMREHASAIRSLLAIVDLSDEEASRYRKLADSLSQQTPGDASPAAHGSVTRAVVALLRQTPNGMIAREIIDNIKRGNFQVRNPETAVRSGLKNLRGRNEVEFVSETGVYRLTRSKTN